MFTKPFSEQHVTGLLLIAMGIIWKMLPVDPIVRELGHVKYSPLVQTSASEVKSPPNESSPNAAFVKDMV